LREQPERVARGDFKLRDGGSIFTRLFGKKQPKTASDREAAALRALERGASLDEVEALVGPIIPAKHPAAAKATPKARGDDDIRALVDEALRDARSQP
jgi:hypothetical protein